ncbi:protein translocase subunit SecA 1 [Benincasa hispida]|uniref:protein translocase subunit SecA 1 n=1 Tax=Benincasa hispida TaxID=102211 RepID=UPI0018FF7CC1|nr:protein translocase subunit SecA 1 [Benincasa hispida]
MRSSSRALINFSKKSTWNPNLFFPFSSSDHSPRNCDLTLLQSRSIFSTTQLNGSWMDKIKGVITGKKSPSDGTDISSESFTLLRFADELKNARRVGAFKQYIVGRSSEATFADAFEKQEAIIRYLGGFDPTGENIQTSQKQEAAKKCNCTIADVENVLAKFMWAKQAQTKIEKLKAEGKPLPTSIAEVQKLVGSNPLDLARSNLAKSGQMSRNALCPCGSKKRYKRCCGKDQTV